MGKGDINFEYYVDYVTKYSKIKLPEALFNNIENDVNKQIMLARFLIRDDDANLKSVSLRIFENAMEQFDIIEDTGIKICLLKEMGILYWDIKRDRKNALKYLNRAFKLAKNSNEIFNFPIEQQIWFDIMTILFLLGKEKKVLEGCKKIIENNFKTLNNKAEDEYTDEDYKKDMYIHYAYLLLAYISLEKGNIESARHYLHVLAYVSKKFVSVPKDKEIIVEIIDRFYKNPH
ncbi:hypothetical protein Q3V94_06905 [Caloramator sp. CAR-1]|uniref:hypothetical protein n=1 Tax=Caloramator sp. CAR-1 TaxID=3062777 RepID=UPI0026E22671|nr:hypothetical protein [Caloramator sp. CAR-1]MDO6354807.1 hypothetical protein [Caloramator sp. CAR-1]